MMVDVTVAEVMALVELEADSAVGDCKAERLEAF